MYPALLHESNANYPQVEMCTLYRTHAELCNVLLPSTTTEVVCDDSPFLMKRDPPHIDGKMNINTKSVAPNQYELD